MTAWIIIRAEVPEADREAFDRWYETEHLPDAKSAFRALSAWRGWSGVTSGVHVAAYEVENLARARAVLASDEMTAMRAEFDQAWQGRVQRTRELVEVAQAL